MRFTVRASLTPSSHISFDRLLRICERIALITVRYNVTCLNPCLFFLIIFGKLSVHSIPHHFIDYYSGAIHGAAPSMVHSVYFDPRPSVHPQTVHTHFLTCSLLIPPLFCMKIMVRTGVQKRKFVTPRCSIMSEIGILYQFCPTPRHVSLVSR